MNLLLAAVPWWGRALALLALAVAFMGFGALKMRQHDQTRYEALSDQYDSFKASVTAEGIAAKKAAIAQAAADKVKKEKADAENSTNLASLRADVKRLRNDRAASRYVPAASPGSSRPDVACYDREQLERTLQQFDAETSGIVAEGDEALVNLNTAKRWAQGR